jgi:hypothetical protein
MRAGIAYLGYKNARFGRNSDGIRHTIQNKGIHDNPLLKVLFGEYSPWFNRYTRFNEVPSSTYFDINANNRLSLWGY